LCVTDVLHVTVYPVNDAPVASANGYAIRSDQVLVVGAPGLLNNDTDVDGDVLTVRLVRAPNYGTLSLNADGSFMYVPDPNYTGIVTFAYRAADGAAVSDRTLVVINVTAISAVELTPDTPADTGVVDDRPTSEPSDPTVTPASKNQRGLQVLTSAELSGALEQDHASTQARTRQPQQGHEPDIAVDAALAGAGQGMWSANPDGLPAHRAAARGRSNDDTAETVVAFVETVPLPAAPEVVIPVVTIAQTEMADLSTLLTDDNLFHRWMIGSAVGVTTGLTVGYVFWTVRAGYLLTGLVAQVPAWRFVDPLPILNSLGGDVAPGDGESLASIVQAGDPV
jgi:hypothetical protein